MTLGKAIKHALKKEIYSTQLNQLLQEVLDERNWLVHKCIDDIYAAGDMRGLFQRLKAVTTKAHMLQRAIEEDLIKFSESLGLDMSNVRASIKQFYHCNN